MRKRDLTKAATKGDLEEAIAHVVGAITKNMATKDDVKGMATKDDLKAMEERQDKKFATKDDIKYLDDKITHLQSDVTDVKRRVIDLESDTPTNADFEKLRKELKN